MTMGCLPQLVPTPAGASWLLAEGGSCSSDVAVLGVFAPSSVGGAGGGAAPCRHFIIRVRARKKKKKNFNPEQETTTTQAVPSTSRARTCVARKFAYRS